MNKLDNCINLQQYINDIDNYAQEYLSSCYPNFTKIYIFTQGQSK